MVLILSKPYFKHFEANILATLSLQKDNNTNENHKYEIPMSMRNIHKATCFC